MPSLIIETGTRKGQVLTFDGDAVIGRGVTADLVLDDGTVSRRHALLTWANGECRVADLETGNGTYVNGRRIREPTRLGEGDSVGVGRMRLRYASGAPPEAAAVSLVDKGPASQIMLSVDADASDSASVLRRAPDPHKKLAALNRRLQVLNELAGDFGQTFEEQALLDRVMERLFEVLPQADRGMVLIKEPNGDLVPRIARKSSGEMGDMTASRTLIREVMTRRQGVLSVDTQGDERFQKVESLVDFSVRTVICVPMLAYDEVFGVIQLDSSKAIQPFDEADVSLVLAVARQLALAMANARMHSQLLDQELMNRDLVLARRIQQRFLTRHTPAVEGFAYAIEYTPALAVGGDFYDFIELPEGRIGVAVGDVSGKGVSAALYVAKLGSELRYNAVGETEPAEILSRVNAALAHDNEEAMFITVVLVSMDPATRELKVANAGHLPPLVRQANGKVVALEGGGSAPLGIREDTQFEQRTYILEDTDVVVLYTDGVTEATDRNQALFGDELLKATIRSARGTPGEIRKSVLTAIKAFRKDEPQNDDITVVAFRQSRLE